MGSRSKTLGFTIVELLVVIVVIGILATITIVSYTGMTNKATVASLTSDLDNASKQLKLDQVVNSAYPASLAAANGGRGIPASTGNSYQYYYNNTVTPQYFCITVTNNSTKYRITNDGIPTAGDCLDYGLVLHLDAGNTASYPSPFNGATWTDLSGLGNNGTLTGIPTYSSANGGILSFDGVDDYVSVGDSATLKPTNQISYSFWAKPVAISNWKCIFGKYNSPRAQFGGTNNLFLDDFPSINKPPGNQFLSNNTFSANVWYFFTYTYDSNSLKLFVNGLLDKSDSSFNGAILWNSYNYTIGTPAYLPYGFVNYFSGQIGEFHIFNRALSSDEITQHFNVTKARYGL